MGVDVSCVCVYAEDNKDVEPLAKQVSLWLSSLGEDIATLSSNAHRLATVCRMHAREEGGPGRPEGFSCLKNAKVGSYLYFCARRVVYN